MAKTDQERLGLFSEPSYISLNDKYKSKMAGPAPFNRGANKKKPIVTFTAKKPKNASGDGYFTKGFDRIFTGEATYDPVKARRIAVTKAKSKNVAGSFKPTQGSKKIVSSGSYDATLGGKIEAMSAKRKKEPKYHAEKRNFTTQPPKKGTGYGYAAVTLSALPEYKTSPYKNEEVLEKKAAIQAKQKMVAGALKLNAPVVGGTFTEDKTVFGPTKMPRSKSRPDKKPKPLGPAFYPSKPLPAMDGSNKNLATFSRYEYQTGKNTVKTEKPKPPKFGQFKPQGVPRSMVQQSVLKKNAARGINSSTYRKATRC